MNKNLMPHEIKLSDSFINENDWEETYKSPIEMIVSQMSSEFDRMAENQLMLKVNQAVDFNVDKAELLKALQYDRNQYETGYLAAKKKYQRPKGKWVKVPYKVCDCEDSNYTMHKCPIAKDYNFNNLTEEEKENCPFVQTSYEVVCDNCGSQNASCYKNFCPNCGADMREVENGTR